MKEQDVRDVVEWVMTRCATWSAEPPKDQNAVKIQDSDNYWLTLTPWAKGEMLPGTTAYKNAEYKAWADIAVKEFCEEKK